MSDLCLTVKQLNDYVAGMIHENPILSKLNITGEISGFKKYGSGHCYFTLKDSEAQLSCVIYKYDAYNLDFVPTDGMRVILSGRATLYPQKGQFQFIANEMQRVGEGDLYRQFIQMRDKLMAEGLFDNEHKVSLPWLPKCIGVATSKSGAVYHDICDVATRRFPNMRIKLVHCSVQGADAAAEIIYAIKKLDADKNVDVIIVGRGGGSIEDLFVFNDEGVARAIYSCSTPIISAVGHEVDSTIADFVADVCAPTPSAAAEIAVPMLSELYAELSATMTAMNRSIRNRIRNENDRLQYASSVGGYAGIINNIRGREQRLNASSAAIESNLIAAITQRAQRLRVAEAKLFALSPDSVLKRGYALVVGEDGKCISSGKKLKPSDRVILRFSDSEKKAEIID